MNVEQKLLDNVEFKLNKQNALFAALGAAFWTTPVLIIWYLVHSYNPNFGAIMLIISGIAIGLGVRIHGKGMKALFSILALIAYTWIVVMAFSLDIVLSGTTWAMFLFGLYVVGAAATMYIARIEVPFEEHRAYSHLTFENRHISNNKAKNKWFSALPVLAVTVICSSFIANVCIVIISQNQVQNAFLQQQLHQQKLEQNKEIDVTPKGLEHMSTKEILLYSYAYHSGLLFNQRGTSSSPFPLSEFKAETILKYLVKYRDNARAKFILGFLTRGAKGKALLEEAVEQGDEYAKIYSTVDYGCSSNPDLALKQLNVLRRVYRDDYIQEEIDSILYLGFDGICRALDEPEYYLSYAQNY